MSDDILKSISIKVDKIAEDVVDVKITQARQEENLKEHMKRADYLEKLHFELYDKVEPLQTDINKMKGAYKLIGILGALTTFIIGTLKLLGKL